MLNGRSNAFLAWIPGKISMVILLQILQFVFINCIISCYPWNLKMVTCPPMIASGHFWLPPIKVQTQLDNYLSCELKAAIVPPSPFGLYYTRRLKFICLREGKNLQKCPFYGTHTEIRSADWLLLFLKFTFLIGVFLSQSLFVQMVCFKINENSLTYKWPNKLLWVN